MTHELKTWPEPFAAIIDGKKRYEIRKNDRDFSVGDMLVLREYKPGGECPAGYTTRWATARVKYMTTGGQWGLPDELCVMSIEVVEVKR